MVDSLGFFLQSYIVFSILTSLFNDFKHHEYSQQASRCNLVYYVSSSGSLTVSISSKDSSGLDSFFSIL